MWLANNSLKFQTQILQIHCYFLLIRCENPLQFCSMEGRYYCTVVKYFRSDFLAMLKYIRSLLPLSFGGCRTRVQSFLVNLSSLATWQAVSGLSPVIIATCINIVTEIS